MILINSWWRFPHAPRFVAATACSNSLVVIALIAMLLGMLLPAVRRSANPRPRAVGEQSQTDRAGAAQL